MRGLSVHGTGAAASIKVILANAVCPVCALDFCTRIRLTQHLRPRSDASNQCRLQLLEGGSPVIAADILEAADQADRLERRRCRAPGINRLSSDGLAVRPVLEA